MDLNTEGRAYVDDLRGVLPHRYGAASRRVFTLPGQVTRFYGGEPGVLEVQIHTEVPEFLASDPSDTLDLGLFLMDAEGNKISVTQRRIRAEVAPVSIRARTSTEVASVVVDVCNQSAGKAGTIGETRARGGGSGEAKAGGWWGGGAGGRGGKGGGGGVARRVWA